jgi:hypothetical protein
MNQATFPATVIDAGRTELQKLGTAEFTDEFVIHCMSIDQFKNDVDVWTLPEGFPTETLPKYRAKPNTSWPFATALGKAAAKQGKDGKQAFAPRTQEFKKLSRTKQIERVKAAARSAAADGRFSKDDIALRAGCTAQISNKILNRILKDAGFTINIVENFWGRDTMQKNHEMSRKQWESVKELFMDDEPLNRSTVLVSDDPAQSIPGSLDSDDHVANTADARPNDGNATDLDDNTALIEDLEAISARHIESTTKESLVNARVGQGLFRSQVLQLWGNCCAVTGSATLDVIRASHIKPWRKSTDDERLDPHNGLPLVASFDALFDAGLITFDSSGTLIVSPKLPIEERRKLNVEGSLRKRPSKGAADYLAYHRGNVFQSD